MENQQMVSYNTFVNLDGTQKGEMKIDVKTGLLLFSNVVLDIDGDIAVGNVDVPITIKMNSTVDGKVL
jgi:hypothetical protein